MGNEKAGDAGTFRDQAESHVLSLCAKLVGTVPPSKSTTASSPWHVKEQLLSQLADAMEQHPREAQEAILFSGPTAVLDSILAIMVSERTQLPSKLLAADVLSRTCSDSKACLLLCPGSIVERLMRFAYKGDADVKAAAARALWQLSCQHDFSPEVVSHAGNAFKVVELLAEDMQGGSSSSACMCALRATQNLLHTYATSTAAGDAGDRIGGRMVEPLCNLLEPAQPEAAAAAAELLALLSATAANRARIVAAGAVPRLVALLNQASSSSSSSSSHVLQQQWDKAAAPAAARAQQEQAAAQAALQVLGQLVRGDAKLCSELLGAHVMPGLLQLLHNESCCAGALSLIGDLAALQEGRRALQYVDGLAVLSDVAQACPEHQLCRLLSKATKSSSGTPVDLTGLASSPTLLAVLVSSCSPADIKTRKRSMQVLARLLEHSRAAGKCQLLQLQQQLLQLGLLQQIESALRLPAGQQRPGQASGETGGGSNGWGTVLEVQLAVSLLQQIAACPDVLAGGVPAALGSKVGTGGQSNQQQVQCSSSDSSDSSDSHGIQKHSALPGPAAAAAAAIFASPSYVWRHPAAAAAAFGDFSQLVPAITQSAAVAATSTAAQQLNPTLPNLLWLLQQLLLSPSHHLSSLQQQVLQAVCEIAAHRHTGLLHVMVQQGWVQVLWSFLPGGKQLLAVTLSQLIQQQQQSSKGGSQAAAAAGAGSAAGQRGTQQQQQQQQQRRAAAASPRSGSSLQPHLLQLLDESLPSLEQTQAALQALAHLCSFPAAAALAAQLQASYQAAAAAGGLTVRTSAYLMTGQQLAAATPTLAGSGSSSANAANSVVAMLFGGNSSSSGGVGASSSPRAVPVGSTSGPAGSRSFGVGPGVTSNPQPQSPRSLPSTPTLSMGSSGSSGGSLVSVPVPSSSMASSSSGGGSSGSLVRSSSTGLLSRLGISRNRDSAVQQRGQSNAAATAAAAGGSGGSSSKGQQQFGSISSTEASAAAGQAGASKPSTAAAAGEPVEDPGSPIQMLVTLLGEQWAATASAELLAHLAAAAPAVCLQEMLDQGVAATLAECMLELQDNTAGAVAALSTLQLVQQLGRHCPEQLHAAGIVTIVLRLLAFECREGTAAAAAAVDESEAAAAAASAVRAAALQVLRVLCVQGDRLLCSTVAQAVLLPLVCWLSSNSNGSSGSSTCPAAAAAEVLTALLDCGVVDGTALAALPGDAERAELLRLSLGCLPNSQQQQQENLPASAGQQQQQQQLTAVRLLRSFVELDGRLVEAFLAADGLKPLITMLSAAVAAIAAAAGSNSSSSRSGTAPAAAIGSQEECRGGPAAAAAAAAAATATALHRQLILQYEMMAILDSLSLCHRRVLVQACIIPIIVGVLRQASRQQQQSAAAATADGTSASGSSSSGTTAAGTAIAAGSSASSSGSSSLKRSNSSGRALGRSSSNAPGAASGLKAAAMSEPEILLRCKVIACNLITVLAINNDVKRQLFHSDAVGPLMQLAEAVEQGSSAQEAIRAALAQLGLVYLMPAAAPAGATAAAATVGGGCI